MSEPTIIFFLSTLFRRCNLHELFAWRGDVRLFPHRSLCRAVHSGNSLNKPACLSPSVGLSQPWRFVIVDDPEAARGGDPQFQSSAMPSVLNLLPSGEQAALSTPSSKLAGLEVVLMPSRGLRRSRERNRPRPWPLAPCLEMA